MKANNSVESGIDYINAKIERRQFYVCERCTGVLSEIEHYHRPDEFFGESDIGGVLCTLDSYQYSAWVNIAINILIRNITRADFTIQKGGNEVTSGPLYELFRRPNAVLSRYDLWRETAAWWNLEGEACDQRSLGWFGPEYTGGLPKALYVLNPRRLRREGYGNINGDMTHKVRRWFYHAGAELIPILSDELIYFWDWNLHGLTSCSIVPIRLRPLPCASMRTLPPIGRRGLRHKS